MRLAAEPIEEADTGLPPKAQGIILHQVLQLFWDEMKSQRQLLERTEDETRLILRTHIHHALRRFHEHAEESWQRTLLDIEADRIENRLMDWLRVEKLRPDFTVVKTEATLEQMHLGGVELRCRIDRIDQVEQGLVLLDYKTGKVDSKACDGERPDEPQLPAYAVLRQDSAIDETTLAGVAFAGLHPRNVDLTVVSSVAGVFPVRARSQEQSARKPVARSTAAAAGGVANNADAARGRFCCRRRYRRSQKRTRDLSLLRANFIVQDS